VLICPKIAQNRNLGKGVGGEVEKGVQVGLGTSRLCSDARVCGLCAGGGVGGWGCARFALGRAGPRKSGSGPSWEPAGGLFPAWEGLWDHVPEARPWRVPGQR